MCEFSFTRLIFDCFNALLHTVHPFSVILCNSLPGLQYTILYCCVMSQFVVLCCVIMCSVRSSCYGFLVRQVRPSGTDMQGPHPSQDTNAPSKFFLPPLLWFFHLTYFCFRFFQLREEQGWNAEGWRGKKCNKVVKCRDWSFWWDGKNKEGKGKT